MVALTENEKKQRLEPKEEVSSRLKMVNFVKMSIFDSLKFQTCYSILLLCTSVKWGLNCLIMQSVFNF